MKKRIAILLALLLLLTGCATQPAKEPDALTDTQGSALPREDLQDQEHYFIGDVMYRACDPIRGAYMYEPLIFLLQSTQELAESIREQDASALSDYDSKFFEKKDLLILYVETGSGGDRFGLSRLARDTEGTMHLELSLLVDGCTDDVGNWQIAIPLDKGTLQKGENIAYRELPDGITSYAPLPDVQYIRESVGDGDSHDSHLYYLTSPEDAAQFADKYLSPYAEKSFAYYTSLDDTFFATHDLLVIPVTEGSGSNRHEVIDLTKDEDGRVTLTILRIIPSEGTCDMAYHQIIIPVEKGLLRADNLIAEQVTVDLLTTPKGQIPVK